MNDNMSHEKGKITPFLWFDKNAEEAVNFYVSIFENNPQKKAGAQLESMKEIKVIK